MNIKSSCWQQNFSISVKEIINIRFNSFLSTIFFYLFPSKQRLVLAVGIICNFETWKVTNFIIYSASSFTDVLGRLQQRKMFFLFSINLSEDKRIEGQEKIYDSYKGIFHYFKAQDFENVSINTKLIQTTHKLFLTAGALLRGNC